MEGAIEAALEAPASFFALAACCRRRLLFADDVGVNADLVALPRRFGGMVTGAVALLRVVRRVFMVLGKERGLGAREQE